MSYQCRHCFKPKEHFGVCGCSGSLKFEEDEKKLQEKRRRYFENKSKRKSMLRVTRKATIKSTKVKNK